MGSLPANEVTTPREPGAEREGKHEISLLQSPFSDGLRHANRDRGGGGVAVLLDIIEHLLRSESELRSYHLIDAEVRLMRDDEIDLLRSYLIPME